MRLGQVLAFFLMLGVTVANAQVSIGITYSDPKYTSGDSLKLEAYEYVPSKWNGQVIVMSHGSTGGKPGAERTSIKYKNISRAVTERGFAFVVYMRKGRGLSEGGFTEESGTCLYGNLVNELAEAESQLLQVVDQVRSKFGVGKVVLMGHSRGGFLSAVYAAKHPEQVSNVINLAGAWSAACESKTGFGRENLKASAKSFKEQFWAYYKNDSYFSSNKFNDPDYAWLSDVAKSNGLTIKVYEDEGMADGHSTPVYKPEAWARDFLPSIERKQ